MTVDLRRRPSQWLVGLAALPAPRRNRWLLAGVAVMFGVLQLVEVGFGYEYGTDEAVYLSQVNPAVPDYVWSAWRAWGMPLLATPVSVTDAPLTTVRIYFIGLSCLGLYLAFLPWLRLSRRPVAPIAAALFGGTKVSLYYGSLVLPNYYSALGAIAATGFFLAYGRDAARPRAAVVGLAGAVAFAALIRPSDGLWLVLPLVVTSLAVRTWRRGPVLGALVVGEVLGWAPWLIESLFRFHGPLERMRAATEAVGGTGVQLNLAVLKLYLRLWSANHLSATSPDDASNTSGAAVRIPSVSLPAIEPSAVIWWLAAVVLLVVGVVATVRAHRSADSLVPLFVAAGVAFPYLFMLDYAQLRFLLPAGGLIAVVMAYGLVAVGTARWVPRAPAVAAAAVLLLGLVGIQAVQAKRTLADPAEANLPYSLTLDRLREAGIGSPCAIAGEGSYTIGYQLGCRALGRLGHSAKTDPAWVADARVRGERIAFVLLADPRTGTFLHKWQRIEVIAGPTPWILYLAPS